MFMGLSWIAIGLLLGLIANRKLNFRGDDSTVDLIVGAAASFVGGALFIVISSATMSRYSVWSLLVAAGAAIVALLIWHFIRTRSPYKIPTVRRSY